MKLEKKILVLNLINLLLFTIAVPMLIHSILSKMGLDYYDSFKFVWVPCIVVSILCLFLTVKAKGKIKKVKKIAMIIIACLSLLFSSIATGIINYIQFMYNDLGLKVAYEIQENLKNPNSLEILGMNCNFKDERVYFFEYTATNSFGGTVRSWGMYNQNGLLISSDVEVEENLKLLYEGYEKLCKVNSYTIRIDHNYINKKIQK